MIKISIVFLMISLNAAMSAMDSNPMQTRSMTMLYREQRDAILARDHGDMHGMSEEGKDFCFQIKKERLQGRVEAIKETAKLGIGLSCINFACAGLPYAARQLSLLNVDMSPCLALILAAGGCIGIGQSLYYYLQARELMETEKQMQDITVIREDYQHQD